MRETDKAAWMLLLDRAHVVVDDSADGKIGLVEADHARQHGRVQAGQIHHAHMGVDVAQERVQEMHGVAALVDADGNLVLLALQELRRRVMVLEIDDHQFLDRVSLIGRGRCQGLTENANT